MANLCNREEQVVSAVINGLLENSLEDHVDDCQSCRNAIAMTSLFQKTKVAMQISPTKEKVTDLIWVNAAYTLHVKRKKMQRLGLLVGILTGILAGIMTFVLIGLSIPSISIPATELLLSRGITFLWPIILIVIIAVYALYGKVADKPTS